MDNERLKVLYLFAGEREETIKRWEAGEGPDSYLIGYNHMASFGIKADYVENRFINRIRKINFNLANLILIKKIREYDVVFSGGSLALPLLAKVILGFKRPKFVWYNTFFTNALKRNRGTLRGRVLRRVILSLDAIVCPSNAQRDFLIKTGCDPKKVFYVPNGVDIDFIERNAIRFLK
ncbi:MAG: glycosyltransferase family 4 protein [Patescibacteria group bacterium]